MGHFNKRSLAAGWRKGGEDLVQLPFPGEESCHSVVNAGTLAEHYCDSLTKSYSLFGDYFGRLFASVSYGTGLTLCPCQASLILVNIQIFQILGRSGHRAQSLGHP